MKKSLDDTQSQPVVFADLYLDKDAGDIVPVNAEMGGWCTGPRFYFLIYN